MTTIYPTLSKNNLDYRSLQFFYGEATLEKYRPHHVENDWEHRKLVAIPMALYTGILLTIHELATAVLLQISKGRAPLPPNFLPVVLLETYK